MSSARHTCNCYDCRETRQKRDNLVNVDDFNDEVRYRKVGKRSRKVCAKSKTGEKCVPGLVKTNHMWYDVTTCARCGRHLSYRWKRL
jgi:hypothetical protein